MVHSSTSIQHPTGRAARAAFFRFLRGAPSRQVALNNSEGRRASILAAVAGSPLLCSRPGAAAGAPPFL